VSRPVVVGEVKLSVSATRPASNSRRCRPAVPRHAGKSSRPRCATGTDRFVAEQDGLLRGQRTEAVVVNDSMISTSSAPCTAWDNSLWSTRINLRVTVSESPSWTKCHGLAVVAQHGKRLEPGGQGLLAHGGQRGGLAEAQELFVQHVAHRHGGAAQRRGGGRVVRGGDDGDVALRAARGSWLPPRCRR